MGFIALYISSTLKIIKLLVWSYTPLSYLIDSDYGNNIFGHQVCLVSGHKKTKFVQVSIVT